MTELPRQSNELVPAGAPRTTFGGGVVVCLAKFSEHLQSHWAERVQLLAWWEARTPAERQGQLEEATEFPHGDAARRLMVLRSASVVAEDFATAYSYAVEIWMNAASDHFYDLDRERAPGALVELADLALNMGHGFHLDGGPSWTPADVVRLGVLWRAACEAVDRQLGADPDWGRW